MDDEQHARRKCCFLCYLSARTTALLAIICMVMLAYIVFFRAMQYAYHTSDPVKVTTKDIFPLLLMTLALVFVPRWESGGAPAHGYSNAYQGFRRGGVCDPSVVRISFGAILFFGGGIWMFLTVVDRWWYPAPPSPIPNDVLPGNLLAIDLLLMVMALMATYLYTTVLTNSRVTLADALAPTEQTE